MEWRVYNQSGDYEYSTTSVEGCDSLAMLSLTINVNDTTSSSISSCVLYTWNDTTYSESGSYSYTYSNVNGCDSVHTIHLTINESSSGTMYKRLVNSTRGLMAIPIHIRQI